MKLTTTTTRQHTLILSEEEIQAIVQTLGVTSYSQRKEYMPVEQAELAGHLYHTLSDLLMQG